MSCVFCRIADGEIEAHQVWADDRIMVFLDTSPLFPGHCLVCPRDHVSDLPSLPTDLIQPLFGTAKLVAKALENGFGAQGSLVAINNTVSQSVPHLHVHVVPRRRQDGLKGFFWPRRPYRDRAHLEETAEAVRRAIADLQPASTF